MRLRNLLPFVLALPAPCMAAPPTVDVCWDYGCDEQERVELPRQDWQRIAELFAVPADDAPAERAMIARAIALFETSVGRIVGTEADLGGNLAGSGRPFQMDCIDESRNTDQYLRVLEARGLLVWHAVDERRKRAPWIFDQHWTAVVTERDGNRSWAVDSWFLDNGRAPYIQPLDAWLEKAELPSNPDAAGHEG